MNQLDLPPQLHARLRALETRSALAAVAVLGELVGLVAGDGEGERCS